jgi:hypothetical protein
MSKGAVQTREHRRMPLRDFHPPLSIDRPWEGFHSTWATAIAELLNEQLLPPQYVAIPLVSRRAVVEIDVATLQERNTASAPGPAESGPRWQPQSPQWTGVVDWPERDLFEVRIIDPADGPRLVSAVELVSPANKDRPASRMAFGGKCAGYLRQGVSVIVVDVVTTRRDSLHAELVELLELDADAGLPSELYAAAYRTVTAPDGDRVDIWREGLAIGAPLPTLPLWLDSDTALPLNLEAAYAAACRKLRIREPS